VSYECLRRSIFQELNESLEVREQEKNYIYSQDLRISEVGHGAISPDTSVSLFNVIQVLCVFSSLGFNSEILNSR
jgi:hypothetical protein